MACETLTRSALIEAGDRILHKVCELRGDARHLFYAVMLFQRECPGCGECALEMVRDSWCRCRDCGAECDPTLQFQSCPDCDSPLILKRLHYWCPSCRQVLKSHFCFDERVFDADYFREMMRESRERKRRQVERMRELLASSRSSTYYPEEPPVPDDLPELEQALDSILCGTGSDITEPIASAPPFDFDLYRRHILELVPGCVVDFEGVSALLDDGRLDRVFRFIAVVSMDHAGELCIEQGSDGSITLVGT